MNTASTDPQPLVAWVTAPRHEELDRYRDWYAARYPAPADGEQEDAR